jgi:hypothetical protein
LNFETVAGWGVGGGFVILDINLMGDVQAQVNVTTFQFGTYPEPIQNT